MLPVGITRDNAAWEARLHRAGLILVCGVTAAQESLTLLVGVRIPADQPNLCRHSPIGRGSGLKIHSVRVRISLAVPNYISSSAVGKPTCAAGVKPVRGSIPHRDTFLFRVSRKVRQLTVNQY
jgi:hypothetical protein